MKRYIIPFVLVSILTACPSPVLRWIETPKDHSGLGRLTGQTGVKEIVSLSFGIDGETDLPIGTDADISGKIPILVILPEGTGLTELIPLVTYIGKSLNPPSGKTGDFSSPVVYTVTAEDATTQDYIVRVYEKGPSTKEIIRLTIDVFREGGSPLGADGIIDQEAGAITVTLPAGTTSLTGLTAHITHTGAGVTGPLGRYHPDETFTFHGDFTNPTAWTVHARDESTKDYTLRVIREKDSAKEITKFSLGNSGETDIIGGEPRSDGVYPILALIPDTAPAPTSITPFISYKGAAISPNNDSKTLNFNTPVRYTVSAEDGTTRDYEVQVIRRHGDNEKKIIGFYFQNPLVEGVIDQDRSPRPSIALTVPAGTNLSSLRPEIYYKGVSVSPMSGQPQSFVRATGSSPSPVVYTVLDGLGVTQPYDVFVFTDSLIPPTVDVPAGGMVDVGVGVGADGTRKSLIFVEFPAYISNPTINIGYPGGPTYNYYDYSTTINTNVEMIVAMPPANPPAPEDPLYGTARIDAFYFTNPAAIGTINQDTGNITVTVPFGTDRRNLTATICYTGKEIAQHPGTTPIKDTRTFDVGTNYVYTVNAYQSGISKPYTVTVMDAPDTAKEITALSLFNGASRIDTSVIISALPNADGNYPIDVTVPAGINLSSTPLTPVITHTGASLLDASSNTRGSGTVTAASENFTGPKNYTVTSVSGPSKIYTVTVHTASADDEPELLGFYLTNPLAVGVVSQNTYAVTVTVPPGTATRALTPTLYFKGVSVRPGSGAVNNFDNPVMYTVTGSTGKTKSYLVTVTPTPSTTKDITRFAFPAAPGAETIIGATPDSDGTYPLAVWVPTGTALGNLAPVITHTGASINPPSGTPQDFNAPQAYTVTAEDGSVKTYRVTVNTHDSNAKILTSFVINEVPYGSPVAGYVRAVGSIDQNDHTVKILVPHAAVVTNLIPTLTYIGRSVMEPGGAEQTANPLIGAVQNFSGNQTYTVKDQNGNGAGYTVTLIEQSAANVTFSGEQDIAVINSFDQQSGVITITVDTGRVTGPYDWYVDGIKQAATGENFTLNVGNGFTPGRHEIMVSGWSGTLHYTTRVYFTVS